MADRPLKPGEKRVYGARVRKTKNDPWKRVKTDANKKGQWGTRKQAQAEVDKLEKRGYVGHTFSIIVKKVAGQPKVDDWLTGNVVDILDVPREHRDDYRDTLYRAARAAKKYGKKVHVNSSYRSMEEQWALYRQNMVSPGVPKPGRPLTAYPNSKAPHTRGIALDIPNARTTPKLIAALRSERLMDDVPSEIWHVTNHARL
jgi:hypothetical protein